MSKRKGRKQPLNSEIKSVMRAPEELESEPAPARADIDSEPAPSGLDERASDALGLEEPAGFDRGPAEAADAAGGQATAAPKRGRLRAVRSRRVETDAEEAPGTAASAELDEAPDPEAGHPGVEADDAREAESLQTSPASDAVDEARSEDEDGEPGGAFGAPFPLDGVEADDTENFLRGLVEALLFTSQKPVELKDLARSAGIDKPRARELLEQLMRSYEGRGLCVEEVAGGFVMRSSPRYAPYIQKILALRPVRLSRAQLETLAIVAYRQPVTKPEVDDIRGVDSGQVIKGLLERSLLKMLGKKDEPGRPTLYGTTNDFLELLNLQSLKDLPTLREYTELSEESQRKFLEETGEAAPSDAMSFGRPPDAPLDGAGAGSESEPPEASDGDGESPATDAASAVLDEDDRSALEGDATPPRSNEDDTIAAEPSDDDDETESDDDDDESDDDDDDESDDDDDDESDDDESDDDESDDDDDDDDDDESDDDDDESDDDDDDDDDESDDDDDESDDDDDKPK